MRALFHYSFEHRPGGGGELVSNMRVQSAHVRARPRRERERERLITNAYLMTFDAPRSTTSALYARDISHFFDCVCQRVLVTENIILYI